MIKRGILTTLFFAAFFIMLITSSVSALDPFENKIKEIVHYAEEYETGNIDYARLVVYMSGLHDYSFSGNNTGRIKEILGEPTEETYRVWNQDEEKDVEVETGLPAWRKQIFDGNKIQIWIGAWPSIRGNESKVYYNLHSDLQFKVRNELRIEEVKDRISSIEKIANYLNDNGGDIKELAVKSWEAERIFGSYFNENPEKCIDVMSQIFDGNRDQRETIMKRITLGSGKYGSVIASLEYCIECGNNNWINLNVYRDFRGGNPENDEEDYNINYDELNKLSKDEIKRQLKNDIMEYAGSANSKKVDRKLEQKIGALNGAWNGKDNEAWNQAEREFNEKRNAFTDEEMQSYDWQGEQAKKDERVKELQKAGYDERLAFYNEIFSGYKSKEVRYFETNFERQILRSYKTVQAEKCDNNIDDNENSLIDCSDWSCNNKKCGEVNDENSTKQMFCNRGKCEVKKDIEWMNKTRCEDKFENIECDGIVLFKGVGKDGCSFEPICVPKEQKCEKSEDCGQARCGKVECVEGICKTSDLSECMESECSAGDKKEQECSEGERINVEICQDGIWVKTEAECNENNVGEVEESKDEILGNECSNKGDCAGDNSVCGNGKCITLPALHEEIDVGPINIPENSQENDIGNDVDNRDNNQIGQGDGKENEASNEGNNEEVSDNAESGEVSVVPVESESPAEGVIGGLVLSLKGMIGYVISGFDIEDGNITENQNDGINNNSQNDNREAIESPSSNETINNQTNIINEENKSIVDDNERKNDADNEAMMKPNRQNNTYESRNGDVVQQAQEQEPQKMENGGFNMHGTCRKSVEDSNGWLGFDGWGEPFGKIHEIKDKLYSRDNKEWCKRDLENIIAQRKEFENSMNEEFAKWFFENYVSGNADNWENQVSGIHEVYWKDVEMSRRMSELMDCLGLQELPEHKLISLNYTTTYGSLTFWEEIKVAKANNEDKEANAIISPYMQVWLLPPKEFIKSELKKAMKEQRFPGPENEESQRDQDNGPSEEERKMIRMDEGFMKKIRKITDKYGGSIDASVQLVDRENNGELIFNLYAQINEDVIMKMKPMPPEMMPNKNIVVKIDFSKVYDLVEQQEKESRSHRIESPPWDQRKSSKVEDAKDMIKIFFKVISIVGDADVEPASAKADIITLMRTFIWKMMNSDHGDEKRT